MMRTVFSLGYQRSSSSFFAGRCLPLPSFSSIFSNSFGGFKKYSTSNKVEVDIEAWPMDPLPEPMSGHTGLYQKLPGGLERITAIQNGKEGKIVQAEWSSDSVVWKGKWNPVQLFQPKYPMDYVSAAAFGDHEHVLAGALTQSLLNPLRGSEVSIVSIPDGDLERIEALPIPHDRRGERFEFFVVASTIEPEPRLWLVGDNKYTQHGHYPWAVCSGKLPAGSGSTLSTAGLEWSMAETLGIRGDHPSPIQAVSVKHWRKQLCLAGYRDSLYAFSYDELIRVHRLDIQTMRWSQVPHDTSSIKDMPLFQLGMTATTIGDKIVLVGGGESSSRGIGVHVFDTKTQSWCDVELKLHGDLRPSDLGIRTHHSATCVSPDTLLVAGGMKSTWLSTKKLSSVVAMKIQEAVPE